MTLLSNNDASTPSVSKNDQDCISVLLSLKQGGGSPADPTAASVSDAARIRDDWDIRNTSSYGSISTTVTASTTLSTDTAGAGAGSSAKGQSIPRHFYQNTNTTGANAATTYNHQYHHNQRSLSNASHAMQASQVELMESKYHSHDQAKGQGPERFYQEEGTDEREGGRTTSPNTVSSSFKDNDDRASLKYFPHMQMVQQQRMARQYTAGVPLSRPPPVPPPPHFYHSHSHSNPRPTVGGGNSSISTSRSWSPSFPASFSLDLNDSLHSRQGNLASSHAHAQRHCSLPSHRPVQPNHRPLGSGGGGGGGRSSSNTPPLVHPFVSLNLPTFCNLNDKKIISNLIGNSTLVDPQDRQYIPDFIFLAMAQLEPCYVTPLDRIGTYKSRKVGFKGMCCKHCKGEPGFGRYFPETLRSLSQTTTTQTIVKHVAYKCRKCPKEVRDSVRALKDYQEAKDHLAKECQRSRFDERPKYGSRKVFFQRLWHRLHGGQMVEDEDGEGDEGTMEKRKALSPREDNQRDMGDSGSLEDSSLEKKHNCSSPGRQRAVSYEDSDGENVPPFTRP
eukprot:CAMPEP_0176481720 /NCGR_PEP_ID=MMETSP0200_2-20121128/2983_1 /TAXON_ID=947934 /ORGANISM="Chaetoceros sp., Strain GSL56" /LENGTH=559 /DNA_ID=CAMNT_0017877969 /DNA_START=143 /DNA_END=1822 /DNA_ORIENTATION=+